MTVLLLGSAALLIALGSGLLYLASPNQRIFPKDRPARALVWIGLLLLAFALVLLLQYSGSGTSVFILFTGVMFMWTIPPMVIAYLRQNQQVQP